jgi:molecular chaperone IbpA
MTTFDFAPLYRSTVGFDRLFEMLDHSVRPDWPPYDIEKTGESAYRITMAIAGFGPQDVEVTQHGAQLLVTGRKQPQQDKPNLLHQGIAQRGFKQTFNLADHVKVAGANIENGLLSVDLVREVPEQLKPRKIQIGSAGAQTALQDNAPKQVEAPDQQRDAA